MVGLVIIGLVTLMALYAGWKLYRAFFDIWKT